MKILVRATNWVGDAVMNLPALEAIVRHHQGAEVHVLAGCRVAPIFQAVDGIAGVMPYVGVRRRGPGCSGDLTFKGAVRLLRDRGFDKAFLFQNAFQAALLAFAAGIPVRVGYATDCRGLLLTSPVRITPEVRRLHHVEYYVNMVRAEGVSTDGLGIPTLEVPARYRERANELVARALGRSGRGGYLAVCPGAAFGSAKRWFPDRFARVVGHVWETHATPSVLLGSETERWITSSIAGTTSGKCVDLAGRTSLLEAAGVLAGARAVLSNDTGLMHLGAAVGPAVVAIFGSTDPAATRPLGDKHVIIASGVECAPCLERTCAKRTYDCMQAIGVDDVCEALDRVMATDERRLEVRG
ncbi:MAG: lipopolysaccharide heptosyltransferase II [Candidatus Coatesbacteria bacterium]|nr:lipopolysaccharide heptosyltransferase II [Candidatus Coatesbacteria bacterium]